jgi:hypothetical protein
MPDGILPEIRALLRVTFPLTCKLVRDLEMAKEASGERWRREMARDGETKKIEEFTNQ